MSERIVKFLRKKDFVLEEEIGHGACGKTVVLYDPLIDERFVCKKYSPKDEPQRKKLFSNFVQEAKLLHLLYHPNVVRVFNYYMYPDQYAGYILMERIVGKEIDQYLAENPEDVGQVFVQTVDGFAHLEDVGILHRDIRPTNILVSEKGVVKIIDFGFGKQILSWPDFDKSISLNWWCEPPIEFGTNRYDFATEVYFVGKLFEESIVSANIEEFPYRSLLHTMCERDPDSRPQSFLKIRQEVFSGKFEEFSFSEDELEAYRNFAYEVTEAFSKIERGARYVSDAQGLLRELETVYRSVMLEETVPSSPKVLSCLINGRYYFKRQASISVRVLHDFLQLFRSCPREKRKIILNNLHNRLDAVERVHAKANDFDDDIPF